MQLCTVIKDVITDYDSNLQASLSGLSAIAIIVILGDFMQKAPHRVPVAKPWTKLTKPCRPSMMKQSFNLKRATCTTKE